MSQQKTCSVTPSVIEKFAKDWAAEMAAEAFQRRVAEVRKKGVKSRSAHEVRLLSVADSIPKDPGPGHPCRNLWLQLMVVAAAYDYLSDALSGCLAVNPPPPPPPIEV